METLVVGTRRFELVMVRHPRARRYLLRLRADGTARVTVPRGGSVRAAREFVQRSLPWLQRQLARLEGQPVRSSDWSSGTEILFRGLPIRLVLAPDGWVHFADQAVKPEGPGIPFRLAVEKHLRRLAARELPARLLELAAEQQLDVRRVNVRNQRTRWGSCSRRATISLNWRLIQTPEFVRDYICLHELAHLREMNHGDRFWKEVERLCPGYRIAESWLKQHGRLLH